MLSFIFNLISKLFLLFLRTAPAYSFPPPLDKDRERELFIRSGEGDLNARAELIERNLRLVAHIIKKYYSGCKDREDLMSIGTIGLIKAIDSYDVDLGARFATYAGKCVQNEILMYFRSIKKTAYENSLSDAVDVDKDGNSLTYQDVLSTDEDITEEIDKKIKHAALHKAVQKVLTERERKIITLRYGLDSEFNAGLPQREVAKVMGISRSYVSRIEKSAVDKLKNYMTGDKNN